MRVFRVGTKTESNGRVLADVSEAVVTFETEHTEDVIALDWGAHSAFIMTCAKAADTKICIWSPQSGALLQKVDTNQLQHHMAALSADGRFAAAATYLAEVKVWEASYTRDSKAFTKLAHALTLRGHARQVNCLCFGPKGLVGTASGDGSWRLFDTDVRFAAGQDAKTLFCHPLPKTAEPITHMLLSADAKVIVFGAGSRLLFVDVKSNAVLDSIQTKQFAAVRQLLPAACHRLPSAWLGVGLSVCVGRADHVHALDA